jgi:hypothetical protein
MYLGENRDPSSSLPAKQLSINNKSRFTLTKVFKLRSEVKNSAAQLIQFQKKAIMSQELIVPR